jgi:hypothetical protein
MLGEVSEVGLGFDEAVRLVVETTDSDACHSQSFIAPQGA